MKEAVLILLACMLSAPWLAYGQAGAGSTITMDTLPNETVTGTTQYFLAKKVSGVSGQAALKLAATTDTAIPLYIVTSGAGTTGDATYMQSGRTQCAMDAINASGVAGYFVVASATTPGKCHAQASPPANGVVIGVLDQDSTSTTAGVYARITMGLLSFVPGSGGAGSGTVQPGVDKAIACYAGAGTEVNDCVPAGSNNLYIKWNGGSPVNSTLAAAGIGVCTNQVVTGNNADAAPTCTTITSTHVNTSIAVTGIDINTSSQVTGASTTFALKADVSPTALSGTIDNYAGCDGQTVCRIDPGAAGRNATGFANGADGRLLVLENVGSVVLVLQDQNTGSSASNRMALGGDVTLQANETFSLLYDATSARWRPFSNTTHDSDAVRQCKLDLGDISASAPALTDDQDTPTTCDNVYGKSWKITSFACKTDSGTVTMQPILTGGSGTSIVTGNVACTSTWTTGTINGTPIVNSFSNTAADGATCSSTPCTADLNIVSVAGGARRIQARLVGSIGK